MRLCTALLAAPVSELSADPAPLVPDDPGAPEDPGSVAAEASQARRNAKMSAAAIPPQTHRETLRARPKALSEGGKACTWSCSVSSGATRSPTTRRCRPGEGLSRPDDRDQRRPLRRPGRQPLFDVLTCVHHNTDAGRPAPAHAERGAVSKAGGGDGGALCDRPEAVPDGAARGSARIHDGRSRLSLPDYPVPGGETQMSFLRKSPTPARANVSGRITTRRARRSPASSI